MHVELLPASAQRLVRTTSNPRQDLVLGYWREVLERPARELAELTSAGLAALRASNVPYLIVAGTDLESGYRQWLDEVLPQAVVTVLPGSGHFPHLAHPDRFAECLADTAKWTANTT
jgi:pimeloyl-ACP methyl ester carboxylesterase